MNRKNIFRVLSLIGMAVGAVGTLLSEWADDQELNLIIDEKIDEKLATDKCKEP